MNAAIIDTIKFQQFPENDRLSLEIIDLFNQLNINYNRL